MIRSVLSAYFEPLHIYHGFLDSSPSTMIFESWICYHQKGVFWSLVHWHVWWWRWSGLAWVLTWLCFHGSWGRWMFLWIGQFVSCIHTSWISTSLVVQPTSWQLVLTWALFWSHWRHFISFWSWPSWPKIVTTTEGSAWINYSFLAALPWFSVSRFKEQMKFCLSLGLIRVLC